MTRNDLVTASDTTPAHAEACRALWDRVRFRSARLQRHGNPDYVHGPERQTTCRVVAAANGRDNNESLRVFALPQTVRLRRALSL